MTGSAIKTLSRPRRFWPTRNVHPPAYTPVVLDREACQKQTVHALTAGELIAMARAARARQSGA